MSILNERQRREVYKNLVTTTNNKFVDPQMNGVDWLRIAKETEDGIVRSATIEDFERLTNELLQRLRTSHIGFFQGDRPKSPGRIAISATFLSADTADGLRWMFQDVHPGGLASNAGLEPGDTLLRLNGAEVVPPNAASFALAADHSLEIRRRNGSTTKITISIPASQDKKRPLVIPNKVVTSRTLDRGIGYLRVSMFPGVLGMDVARDISRAIAELDVSKLVVDLRGNTGGGIGCLRLMSILSAGRLGVGYTLGRKQIERNTQKEELPAFERIPSSKWEVIPLLFRFGLAGRAVAVFSESLGPAKHHGNVAVLVNEHSASASEMVAAFASEYELAKLVGAASPGKVVAASSFKVGHVYRVALPVGSYFTWHGTKLEGRGIAPNVHAPTLPEDLLEGKDAPLQRAIEALR